MKFKVINNLITRYFLLTEHVDDDQYYFSNDLIVIEYITPHSGTDNKHMVRAEIKSEFHKFDDAQLEEFFVTDDELKEVILKLEKLSSDAMFK
ncbi:hypothetical protein ABD91_00720 [Lysinibacillus sphaericus]|uniref:hypothetical protein n=1 Tax=Lysinibacillus sphaericus TaxID=1421 RepID=UPI0018CFEB2C|nr:hypothetical protein [Lysinibacillus sphaericus]MBG9689450.1 hypothetical protein [Lysinibacillus sphaericus]